jgi:hypothetical protein
MRCKGCGYSLFNHRGRTCPECGAAFTPSDFEFIPNAVEFCCPGCMQQYYGVDPRGLIDPRTFDCVGCGAPCDLGSMVLRPAPGVPEDRTELLRVPWEDGSRGRWKRFGGTLADAMGRPTRLGAAIATSQGGGSPLAFLSLVTALATIPTALAVLAFMIFSSPAFVGGGGRFSGATIRQDLLYVLVVTAISIGSVLLLAALLAGLAVLVLRATGADARWRQAWPAFAYTAAPFVICVLPCIGPYCGSTVAGTWWMVCAGIAIAAACRVSAGRAVAAVLVPVVVLGAVATAVFVVSVVLPTVAVVNQAAASAAAPAVTPAGSDAAPAPDAPPAEDPEGVQ